MVNISTSQPSPSETIPAHPPPPFPTTPSLSPTSSEQATVTGRTNRYYLHSNCALLYKAIEKLGEAYKGLTKETAENQFIITTISTLIMSCTMTMRELDQSLAVMNELKEEAIEKLARVECLLDVSNAEFLDSEASEKVGGSGKNQLLSKRSWRNFELLSF